MALHLLRETLCLCVFVAENLVQENCAGYFFTNPEKEKFLFFAAKTQRNKVSQRLRKGKSGIRRAIRKNAKNKIF